MIEFKIIELVDKQRLGLMVRGHAYYAKNNKDDIVCASVSSIAQAAANGCIAFGEDVDIKSCRPGRFVFTAKYSDKINAIIKTAYFGIQSIAEQYPQCFKQPD